MTKSACILAASLLAAGAAAAQTPAPAARPMPHAVAATQTDRGGVEHTTTLFKTRKGLETVTCAQFIALDDSFKPQAVNIAANYGPHGHAHPTETVTGTERITPDVVTACQARPGDHMLGHVRTAMKSMK